MLEGWLNRNHLGTAFDLKSQDRQGLEVKEGLTFLKMDQWTTVIF